MPKMKTNRGAAKRFKKTGGFKKAQTKLIRRGKAFRRHILTKKTTKTKRDLRQPAYVHAANVGELMKLLPY